MRRTIIARTPEEITGLREAWEALEVRSPVTIFQTFQWSLCAARAFGDRESPKVLFSETDSGQALLPLALDSHGQLKFLGERMFDYGGVLFNGDPQVLYSSWRQIATFGHRFSGGALRADQLSAWDGFDLSRFYAAPRVSPAQISAEKFTSEHPRLGRWFRARLDRQGVELRCYSGTESPLVRFIYQKKAEQPSDGSENLFSDPRRIDFMATICAAIGSACEIFTLESAGTLVAALMTFRDREVRRFYTIYFDPAWAKFSPGMCLVYEVTRRSLQAGLECDYMTGEHAYKMRLATSVVPMYWAVATPETLAVLGSESVLAA